MQFQVKRRTQGRVASRRRGDLIAGVKHIALMVGVTSASLGGAAVSRLVMADPNYSRAPSPGEQTKRPALEVPISRGVVVTVLEYYRAGRYAYMYTGTRGDRWSGFGEEKKVPWLLANAKNFRPPLMV